MEETVSITSSGTVSANSDDFEMLSAPSSPPEVLPSVTTGDEKTAQVITKPTAATSPNPGKSQPQLDIANNGSMADLHKQMNEVLRDTKSNPSDCITREDDPAILKSLDATPESNLASPLIQTNSECIKEDKEEEKIPGKNHSDEPSSDPKSSPHSLLMNESKGNTADNPSSEEYTIFNRVYYLGAASISFECPLIEIYHNMSILFSQVKEQAIQVSLSVPSHSEGFVIIYDALNKSEMTKYQIHLIRKCIKGKEDSPESSCFAFMTNVGTSPATSIMQCHVFKCQIPEAAGRIVECFGSAFHRLPKSLTASKTSSSFNSGGVTDGASQFMFDVALEIKEEDSKGNFYTVPRDKEYFKLRCNVEKELQITVTPSPPNGVGVPGQQSSIGSPGDSLSIYRCFGLLIANGHNVKNADMNLLEIVSNSNTAPASISQNSPLLPCNKGAYVVSGRWDPKDPIFGPLNQESPKDGKVLMSVAVDMVMKGIQEPVRFVLNTRVRIYPQNERFWYFTKKPLIHLFSLNLQQADMSSSSSSLETQYTVVAVSNMGEVERLRPLLTNGLSLPLNLSSLTSSTLYSSLSGGRSPSIASIDTPGGEDSDDDEPLLSGSGEVSKECSQSELDQWKLVLPKWQTNPAVYPKEVTKLVRRGVPEALRGEVWQLLAGCSNDDTMMENYRMLLTKECPVEQVILRDINRTFPAHEFFKESGGCGQEALYKISRAYAVYDEELSYCQGLSFLAAALLLHMPEEQAFCVLVKIMSDYGFRNLFKDGFEVLNLRFYQLDRLMEDQVNDVYNHFQDYGVATHMFASQWFLTLYTSKFPLFMVFHYLDFFLLMGFDSVFQVAIALLTLSRKDLTALDFEGIMKYFRVTLPKKYRNEMNVRSLFKLATSIKVKKLEKYQRDYLLMKGQETDENLSVRLEQENRKLLEEKLRLDAENDVLARRIDLLEESSERANREIVVLKKANVEAEQEKQRLTLETSQVKELLKNEVMMSESEQKKSVAIVSEYKQICQQLSTRIESEHKEHQKTLNDLKVRASSCQASDCTCKHLLLPEQQTTSSFIDPLSVAAAEEQFTTRGQVKALTEQVRELELQLAQTKLSLVETQCKNQDLTHQLNSTMSELQTNKNTWFQKTLTSISGLKEKTPSTSSQAPGLVFQNTRPTSPSVKATETHSRTASLDSTNSLPSTRI